MWISRDPIGYDGGIGLYAYCGGDPVMGADPSGLTVTATFDREAGTLAIVDDSNPKNRITIQNAFGAIDKVKRQAVFSGGGKAMNNPAMERSKMDGPIPAGQYLIGLEDDTGHMRKHFPLLAKENDWQYRHDVGIWGKLTGQVYTGRDMFNFHSGRVSDGCVTVWSTVDQTKNPQQYPDSPTWETILSLIKNSGGPSKYSYANGKLSKVKNKMQVAVPGSYNGVMIVK